MVTVSTGWRAATSKQEWDTGRRMDSEPWLFPTAKGTFGSAGKPIWLEEMCRNMEKNVHKCGGKCAEMWRKMRTNVEENVQPASTARHIPALTAPYLQRQDVNVVSDFPGGNLGVLTLLLLQISLLDNIHLQGSTGH